MKLNWFMSVIIFLITAIILLPMFLPSKNSMTVVDLNSTEYKIGSGVEKKWSHFCISSQFEIIDYEMQKHDLPSCSFRREVPAGKIYMIYVHNDNSCSLQSSTGHLFSKRNFETRCLGTEISGRRILKTKENIVFIKGE